MAKRKSALPANGHSAQTDTAVVEDELSAKRPKVAASLADLSSEDEDDDGDDDEEISEDEEEEEPERPSRSFGKDLSAEEVQVARETSELFKSNIFKMQIDELLAEVKLSAKHTQLLDKVLFQLNETLREIPTRMELPLAKAISLVEAKSNVKIPFPDPKPAKDVQYKFGLAPPSSVNVVGSYSLKTAVKQPEGVAVDLLVTMPESLFQAKDYVNYRYFHKRAFYLGYVASHLASSDLPISVSYKYFNDDPLRPILHIIPTGSALESRFSINLLLGAPVSTFEPRKLGPDRNCVRVQDIEEAPPTGFYNSSVLSDLTYTPYLEFLHRASLTCDAFKDACKLGRLWLRQRGFASSHRLGGFGAFEWSLLMAALLQGGGSASGSRVLLSGYSSYQLFKATVGFLANHDLSQKAVSFSTVKDQPSKQEQATGDCPGLRDRNFKLNVLWKMSSWSYKLLRHEASVTSDLLTDVVVDRFANIFMESMDRPELRYDTYFKIAVPPSSDAFTPSERVTHINYQHFFSEKLYRVLSTGLEGRAFQISMLAPSLSKPWAVSKRKSNIDTSSAFEVGVILDSAECEKLVTHGPPSDDATAAAKFRNFWGAKSELRRFQDGSIEESVVWNQDPVKPIVTSIVEYVVSRHLPGSSVLAPHDKLLEYIPVQQNSSGWNKKSVVSTALFQRKYTAFQKLAVLLQEISDLPLRIRSVLPTSSSLRFTSIVEPCENDFSADDCIASGIIEFESSGKWPDDSNALERTKIAFLLKIVQEVRKKHKNYEVQVGTESGLLPGVEEIGFIQLQTPEGYSFKLRVRTDRDELLISRLPQSESALALYKQNYTDATTHNRYIHTLCLRYPMLSASIRLLKVWFRSHLISSHVPEQVVELIALKPFLSSSPFTIPGSVSTAFYRTLDFLSLWDWRQDPLILDVEKASDVSKDEVTVKLLSSVEGVNMNASVYQKLADTFKKHRNQDPVFTVAPLFIGTKHDASGIVWSQQIPKSDVGKLVATRMTALSRAVIHNLSEEDGMDYDLLFTPSLRDFDVVIHVKNPSAKETTKSGYKNLQLVNKTKDFDEIVDASVNVASSLFDDLQKKYEGCLVLFYSGAFDNRSQKKQFIVGIWRQDALDARKFRVNIDYSTVPVDKDVVVINKPAIIEEIRRIGGDIISSIEV